MRSWESSRGRRGYLRTLHRRTLVRLLLFVVVIAALVAGGATALASGKVRDAIGGNLASPPPAAAPAPDVPPALTVTPAAGAAGVNPRAAVRTGVDAGELRDVALTSDTGTRVAGTLSADRHSWSATEPLGYGKTYTWSGSWVRPDGAVLPLGGAFGTVDPARTAHAMLNIADDADVGVGAPIILQFDRNLSDAAKATVQKSLSVTTSRPAEGAWAWLPDSDQGSRVHYRTKAYWPAHTTVTVNAPLYGLDLGKAGYGQEDLHSTFTVGRSQIVKADTGSHQIVVITDGKESARFDASYGKESDPNRVTRGGTHIVMSKSQKVLMTNPAYGYTNIPEYWAVRISNNGEFIHANPASSSAQGSSNVTHGCVNLSTKDAQAYFGSAEFGDPVEVTGSSQPLSATDGDIYDWTIPWDKWKAMSAAA